MQNNSGAGACIHITCQRISRISFRQEFQGEYLRNELVQLDDPP